jgi:hypothetical protein
MRPVWSATEAHPRRDASNVCTHRHGPHRPDRPTPVKRRPRLPTPNESNGSGRYLVATGIDQRTWQTSIGNIYVISDLNGAPERIRTSDLCLRRAAGSDRRARPNNLSGASIRSEIGALVSKDRMVEVQTMLVASPRNQYPLLSFPHSRRGEGSQAARGFRSQPADRSRTGGSRPFRPVPEWLGRLRLSCRRRPSLGRPSGRELSGGKRHPHWGAIR